MQGLESWHCFRVRFVSVRLGFWQSDFSGVSAMKSSSFLVSPVVRLVTILSLLDAVAAPLAQTQVSDRGQL